MSRGSWSGPARASAATHSPEVEERVGDRRSRERDGDGDDQGEQFRIEDQEPDRGVGHRKADLSASVENEWLCMNLLAEFGLPVPQTALLKFGAQKVFGVERFV